MDAWNSRMPIKNKVCDKLLKVALYCSMAIIIELFMFMFLVLS